MKKEDLKYYPREPQRERCIELKPFQGDNMTETRLEDLDKYHQSTKNTLLLPHFF